MQNDLFSQLKLVDTLKSEPREKVKWQMSTRLITTQAEWFNFQHIDLILVILYYLMV